MNVGASHRHRPRWIWPRVASAVIVLSSGLATWLVVSGSAYGSPLAGSVQGAGGSVRGGGYVQLGGGKLAKADPTSGVDSNSNNSDSSSDVGLFALEPVSNLEVVQGTANDVLLSFTPASDGVTATGYLIYTTVNDGGSHMEVIAKEEVASSQATVAVNRTISGPYTFVVVAVDGTKQSPPIASAPFSFSASAPTLDLALLVFSTSYQKPFSTSPMIASYSQPAGATSAFSFGVPSITSTGFTLDTNSKVSTCLGSSIAPGQSCSLGVFVSPTVSDSQVGVTTGVLRVSGAPNLNLEAVVGAIPPSAPTAVGASPGPSGTGVISFSPPLSSGGAEITSYSVSSKDLSRSEAPQLITVATSTLFGGGPYSVTVQGLKVGDSYEFLVYATNSAGQGPSATTNVVKISADLAALPTPSSSALTFTSTITKTFSPQTVTYLEPATTVPFKFPSVYLSPKSTPFVLQNSCSGVTLASGQKCTIQITPDPSEAGSTSATLVVTGFPALDVTLMATLATLVPAPPSSVSAVSTPVGAIVTAVIAKGGGDAPPILNVAVTPYDITTDSLGTTIVQKVTPGIAGVVTISITGLTPNNVYDFSVVLSNGFGSSIAVTSNQITVGTFQFRSVTSPPSQPVNNQLAVTSLASAAPKSPATNSANTTSPNVPSLPIVTSRSSLPVLDPPRATTQVSSPDVVAPTQVPSYVHISKYSLTPLGPTVHGVIIFSISQASGIPGSLITVVDRSLPVGCVRPEVLFNNQVVATPSPVNGLLPQLRIAIPGDAVSGRATITVTCIGAPTTARSVGFMVYVPSVHLGMLSTAVLLPSQISFSAKSLAKSAAVAALAIPFVAFPTEFLNATLEEHEDDLIALRNRFRRKKGSTGGGPASRISNNVRLTGVLLMSALLYGLLDPKFSFNESSLLIFLGLLVGLTVITLAADLPAALYLRRKDPEAKVQGHVLPGAIGIAAVCVVISRALHFEPGYLYGMVAGLQVVNKMRISENDSGKAQVLSFMTTLAVALAAWLARQPLSSWTHSNHASVVAVGVDAALVSIFIAGVQGVLISLLPLRFLPGRDIYKWNKVVWALLLGIAAFIFFHLLLGQGSSYVGTINGTIAAAIFTGLFVGATIAAWVFFAIRDRKREATSGDDPEQQGPRDEDRVSFSLSSASNSDSDGE
ncbi:MAG: hypothetical protein HKL81_00350 [Acidimicrobiaceae bacterium]|nr:hypothetical protein [Acidimicrobiaceae bacterium]